MKHISKIIDEILVEWAYRAHDGMPNPKNPLHLVELQNSLNELRIPRRVAEKLLAKSTNLYNLENRKKRLIKKVFTIDMISSEHLFIFVMATLI